MATILSTPTNINVVVPGTSALARLAASMAPGQWASFTMGGMSAALLDVGDGIHSITEWANRGHWDPVHKKIQFWGHGHYSPEKLITWDDATNVWTGDPGPVFGQDIAHGYYHLALDPATGDMYLRAFNSTSVKKKPYGGAWTSIASFANIGRQVASGLEWFPALHGGRGGLVFIDVLSCQTWDPATNRWTTRSSTLTGMGALHNWIAAAGGYVYFGGGNGSRVMYRLAADGTLTSAPSTPLEAGIWSAAGAAPVLSHPDGSQLLQFAPGSTGAIYRFNGSAWVAHGTHQIGPAQWVGTPISDYGVVLFFAQAGSGLGYSPVVKVYKP
jgi:hypothetical protein